MTVGRGVGENGGDDKKGATARGKPHRIPLRGNETPIKSHISVSNITMLASFPSIESVVPTSTLSYPACLYERWHNLQHWHYSPLPTHKTSSYISSRVCIQWVLPAFVLLWRLAQDINQIANTQIAPGKGEGGNAQSM